MNPIPKYTYIYETHTLCIGYVNARANLLFLLNTKEVQNAKIWAMEFGLKEYP